MSTDGNPSSIIDNIEKEMDNLKNIVKALEVENSELKEKLKKMQASIERSANSILSILHG